MTIELSSSVQITETQDSILMMKLDLPGKGANVLSATMFDEIEAALLPWMERDDIKGLILFSGKPKIFVAGANLNEIVAGLDWPDERIIAFCERGRQVMAMFHSTPFVTVAAIHGACVGGGFELALWCDRRIATDDRRTVIGLPEVKLGLIPGWAGTIRVGRLAGIETQLEMVTSAKLLSAADAKKRKLVDEVVAQDDLIDHALATIRLEQESKKFRGDRDQADRPIAAEQIGDPELLIQQQIEKITAPENDICPVAPLIALEHIVRAASLPLEEACRSESIAFAEAWGSEPSFGLLHNFFLSEHNRKNPGWSSDQATANEIQSVGIAGAGVMGSTIALNNLQRRKLVTLFDPQAEQIRKATEYLAGHNVAATIARSPADFANVDLVIESVTESPPLKKKVLADLEKHVAPTATIATNTSAIPVSQLAECLRDPTRFCGIHFCHPQLMSLVELIPAATTSDDTTATALGYIRSLGKMAIVVADRAGFAVNRLLATMLDGAIGLLIDGLTVSQIDTAMREFGFRGGPFEIVDVIGADTCLNAGRAMWDGGLRCMTVSPILPRLVKLGRLGRKSGKGFYQYAAVDAPAQLDPELGPIIAPYQSDPSTDTPTLEAIWFRILAPMVLEADAMLREKLVADPRDIDIATIHGFSFPAHRGGLLFWADRVGLGAINSSLHQLSMTNARFKPSTGMIDNEKNGIRFHPPSVG